MKKKIWIVNAVGIFLLSFLCHFIYDWFPNKLTCLFFPVNESIWEHVKMLFTTNIVWGVIAFFLYRKIKIPTHNLFPYLWTSGVLNCIILLALYLPLYYLLGEHMILTLIILFVSIIITQYITSRINERKEAKLWNFLSLIAIVLTFCLLGYLTYHPLKTELFYDKIEEKYGLWTLK